MSNKLEKAVRDPCVAMAKRLGVLHKRMHFGHGASNGWPDDLFVFPFGHEWHVEFKREGGAASALQEVTHAQMRRFNMDVSVIDNRPRFEEELTKRLGEHS